MSLGCGCDDHYRCPKCKRCFQHFHRSFFMGNMWYWICRMGKTWPAHGTLREQGEKETI